MPTIEVLSEQQSQAFLVDHFIKHNAPMVAPVGDVKLSVETLSGTTPPVERVELVIESGGEQQRTAAEKTSGGWAVTVSVGDDGLRYRFELTTADGVVALPADHTFVNLYAAAQGTADIGASRIDDLASGRVQEFLIGSGDGQLGRNSERPAGSEGLDLGPGGVVALADGRVAIFDPWNGRVLVAGVDGAVSAVTLVNATGQIPGDPPLGAFAFTAAGLGAYMDRTAVYTVGGVEGRFVAVDPAGVNGVVGALEVHGDRIVARRSSGEFQVVGTLNGSEPAGALDGLPDAVIVNELFDAGMFFFLPESPLGHLTFSDAELIPVGSRLTTAGDAVLVVASASDGSLFVVHVKADGSVRTVRLVDEGGAAFMPGSAFDGGPGFSVAPDGSSLAVLSCATAACTLRTFDLRVV